MQESVIYQELREEAREEAFQQVREEMRQALRQEAREEALQQVSQEVQLKGERALILRLLTRKVGEVPSSTKAQIETLNLVQLEDLGEALLNFATLADLTQWLEQLPQ
ncbi:MAG: DUF4351 domain-containing protein [Leptolyngbyaceae cyanobacterium SL_7_1]|nr:DUF4351 domain-containing protein [Leptolyngbyaceae cyanobacterium SL_7_1]